jgi:glycosyltransferase involved in cell wall biosynthesis
MLSPREAAYGVYLGDLDRGRTESQGMISYALALTRALADALEPHERLVAFCSDAAREELGDVCSRRDVDIVSVDPSQGARHQVQQDQFGVGRLVARSGVEVVHFPRGRAPWRSLAPAKVVATIHDDIPMQYRAGRFETPRRDLKSAYVVANLRRTLMTADAVLTDSEFSRRQLEAIAPKRADSITVVVPGLTIGGEAGAAASAAAREPRFVVFDSPFAHKRADEAAEFALRYIVERELADHKVLLLGSGRGATVRARCPDRFENEPGGASSERVDELVRSSRAVVVASRYEGLGLPALEAWARGTPAVVADSEAAAELLHGVPGLYRGGDYASFAPAFDRVLALDGSGRNAWSKLVNRRCDWSRAAAEVLSVYRELVAPAGADTDEQDEEIAS